MLGPLLSFTQKCGSAQLSHRVRDNKGAGSGGRERGERGTVGGEGGGKGKREKQAGWQRARESERERGEREADGQREGKRCREDNSYRALLQCSTVWKAFLITSIALSISFSLRWALTARRMLKIPPHRLNASHALLTPLVNFMV